MCREDVDVLRGVSGAPVREKAIHVPDGQQDWLFVVVVNTTPLRGYYAPPRAVAAGTTGTALGSMRRTMLPYVL